MNDSINFAQPRALAAIIETINDDLGQSEEVSPETSKFASSLVEELLLLPEAEPEEAERYLREAIREGGALLLEGLLDDHKKIKRRKLRQGLEEIRQALVEVDEGREVSPRLTAGEVTRWILDVTDASQKQLSTLLAVDLRTLQRWLSNPATKPRNDEDELKLRVAARCINHLRTSLSRPGILRWFERPHPDFKRRTPAGILQSVPKDPEKEPALIRAAAQMRSSGGT